MTLDPRRICLRNPESRRRARAAIAELVVDPNAFSAASRYVTAASKMEATLRTVEPMAVAVGILPGEVEKIRYQADRLREWLEYLLKALEEEEPQ